MPGEAKNWCWTLNDPDEVELVRLKLDHDGIGYICFQEEIAPTTGRPHLQGYVQLEKKAVLNSAKKILFGDKNHRVHLEKARGSPDENKTYCSKEGGTDFFEWGVMSRAGKSKDLGEIASAISKEDR